jgi:hypothetical protein
METVDLVSAVIAGDREAAKAAFDAQVAAKMTDALELKKVEIATSLLTPKEETVDEPTESQEEVDGTANADATAEAEAAATAESE